MESNIGVVSFAGGSPRWYLAGIRLKRQCKKSGKISQIEVLNPRKINKLLDGKTKEFIRKNPKGYGYWVWKPYVVTNFLENHPKIDYVLFLDAGCELRINEQSSPIWNKYLEFLENYVSLTFDNGQLEKYWTKKELVYFLNPTNNQLETKQLAAGVFFMRRDFALSFCEEWISTMREKDFFYITDLHDEEIQSEGFCENRYDQSVFSLLIKKYPENLTLVGNEEIYFPGKWELKTVYPIWTIRNASFVPTLEGGLPAKSIRVIESLLHISYKVFKRLIRTK